MNATMVKKGGFVVDSTIQDHNRFLGGLAFPKTFKGAERGRARAASNFGRDGGGQ